MKPTYGDIKRLFGDIDDHTIAEIEASEATIVELEEVVSYLAQKDDIRGDANHPLSGRGLAVFNLLRSQDERWDEDR